MELSILIPLSILLVLFLHIAAKRFLRRPNHSNLPPGPWKLPVIGSIHHLLGRTLPHRRLADLAKKHGPLMHLQLGEVPVIVISSAEVAKEAFQTHDTAFASRPKLVAVDVFTYGSSNLAFAPYGEYWREARKIFMVELLTAKRVQSFRSIREDEAECLIRSIAEEAVTRKIVDFKEKILSSTHNVVSRAAFGRKLGEQGRFFSLLKEGMELAGSFNAADYFPSWPVVRVISGVESRIRRCHRELDGILEGIVVEHRKERERRKRRGEDDQSESVVSHIEDFVDVLLRIQEREVDFRLTDDSIKALISDVFVAGLDTSTGTMEWAMSELMRNPEVMQKAQQEVRQVLHGKTVIRESDIQNLSYLKLIIKETLRLHPPGPLLVPKESNETCTFLGYQIPEKTRVLVNAWAIATDPRHWDEPEVFKPERFATNPMNYMGNDFKYMPFGVGRRICPGIVFGLANMELPFARLLYHFDWELPHGITPNELDMTESDGQTAPRKSSLHLLAIPRFPLPTE